MPDPDHSVGSLVAGYRPQGKEAIALVNQFKQTEERLLRELDAMADRSTAAAQQYDQRWLAIARTNLEQGFMALNRAVFRPDRVKLPEDD